MNGFDDIINNLDGWINRPQDPLPQPSVRPPPPKFTVGEFIVIRETRWPPETGRINQRTGLYTQPGFPVLSDVSLPNAEHDWRFNPDLHRRLQENLGGVVNIGDVCKILAVWCHEDGKTYYFLDNGKPDGKGWTRCSFRFRPATPGEAHHR